MYKKSYIIRTGNVRLAHSLYHLPGEGKRIKISQLALFSVLSLSLKSYVLNIPPSPHRTHWKWKQNRRGSRVGPWPHKTELELLGVK